MNTLVSSYPFGEQLSLDVSPNDALAFVAEGAVITVLDLLTVPAQNLGQVPLPDCQPLAQRYYKHPVTLDTWLFIAGGAQGLWRVSVCPHVYATPPQPCLIGAFSPTLLDLVDGPSLGYTTDPAKFERKRCVDVAILDAPQGGGGNPVLFALFAASSLTDPSDPHSDIGPTELRAYTLSGSNVVPLASCPIPAAQVPGEPEWVGTCLAVDNGGSPDAVYVGMGRGGIWKAVLSGPPTPSLTALQLPSVGTGVSYVADIAAVRVYLPAPVNAYKSFLYAAMDYDQIGTEYRSVAEYDISSPSPTLNARTPVECGYPHRIAAVIDGTDVRIALGVTQFTAVTTETLAPISPNSYWDGLCFSNGVTDPHAHALPTGCTSQTVNNRVQFFSRDLSASPTPLDEIPSMDTPLNGAYGSLVLHKLASAYRMYVCTSGEATAIYDVTWSSAPVLRQNYVGSSLGAQKGAVSLLNPEIVRFGGEGPGKTHPQGGMAHIDSSAPYTITGIPGTLSACPQGVPPATCDFGPFCKPNNENPFAGGLLGEANWLDPNDPNNPGNPIDPPVREFFFTGAHTVRRVTQPATGACVCNPPLDDCLYQGQPGPWDPCSQPETIHWSTAPLPTGPTGLTVGWKLVNLMLPSGGTTTGPQMDMHWRQVSAPRGAIEKAAFGDYVSAVRDDRTIVNVSGLTYPSVIYGLRGGSDRGLKVVRPSDFPVELTSACGTSGGGFGEEIPLGTSAWLDALTHVEFESIAGEECLVSADCSGQVHTDARKLYNNQSELFKVRTPAGKTHRALAVAAGFVAGRKDPAPLNPPALPCSWELYNGRPLIVFFRVTGTGDGSFSTAPELWRVALGNGSGHAFCVRTKSYPVGGVNKYYAFVGVNGTSDPNGLGGLGRVIVFDVSLLTTALPASSPYLLNHNFIDPVQHPPSPPVEVYLPKDPYDGAPPNVIDLAIEGNYLYCALGRGGVAIIDITDPEAPVLIQVMDTPGLALGLTLRTVPDGRQLIVGDSRGGVRLYQ